MVRDWRNVENVQLITKPAAKKANKRTNERNLRDEHLIVFIHIWHANAIHSHYIILTTIRQSTVGEREMSAEKIPEKCLLRFLRRFPDDFVRSFFSTDVNRWKKKSQSCRCDWKEKSSRILAPSLSGAAGASKRKRFRKTRKWKISRFWLLHSFFGCVAIIYIFAISE